MIDLAEAAKSEPTRAGKRNWLSEIEAADPEKAATYSQWMDQWMAGAARDKFPNKTLFAKWLAKQVGTIHQDAIIRTMAKRESDARKP